jgi:hypothetical protein
MSSRSQRINKAVESLVRQLLVEVPGEDASIAEERKLNAVEFVHEILERYVDQESPDVEADLYGEQFQNPRCSRRCEPSLRSDQETIDTDESKSRESSQIYKSV